MSCGSCQPEQGNIGTKSPRHRIPHHNVRYAYSGIRAPRQHFVSFALATEHASTNDFVRNLHGTAHTFSGMRS